jgi:hypothetical protein
MTDGQSVVDAIFYDPKADEYAMVLSISEPLSGDRSTLELFQERLNRYLAFILDGELARKFPGTRGKRVRIEIDFLGGLDSRAQSFLGRARIKVGQLGIGLVCREKTPDGGLQSIDP